VSVGLRRNMPFRVQACFGTNPEPHVSALGHKRTGRGEFAMSVLPPKADIDEGTRG